MPKESLKDKLDGNELDLSMSNMITVPVKELAALPKATVLDLSNNSIIQLPDDFCTLTHIVKLDLSKNSLTQLPERFGALQKLQHLDLLGNLLTTLPVSMTHLKNLKWLDLKDNPLDENLKDIVGNCLDDTECKRCAKNVVSYYKTVESNLERERQRKLKEDREIESKRKAEEEKVRQRKKAEKQLEKDRRRKEYQLKQQEKEQLQSQGAEYDQSDTRVNDGRGDEMAEKKRDEVSCWSVVVKSVVSLLVVFVALYVFCEYNPLNQTCRDVRVQLKAINLKAEELFENFFENTLKVAD